MNKDLRAAVIELHSSGKGPGDILRLLRHRKINPRFIYRTVKRYTETGSVDDRPRSGRPVTATSPRKVRKLRHRLLRNPRRSARKLALDLQISERSVRRMLTDRLKVRPYKIRKVQQLTEKQKKVRLDRVKRLRTRFASGRHKTIVFSDEKIFTVEQVVNRQNDRIWQRGRSTSSPDVLRATRSQGAASVMVWAGISACGRTPLVFVPQGVKINAEAYKRLVLEETLLPWAREQHGDRPWTYQQDSAPAHRARTVQDWLRAHTPDFIGPGEWPPYSPDLNPLDFAVWSLLESKVCAFRHTSLDSLKRSLRKAWSEIPQEVFAKSADNFMKRLGLCVKARGGHFEDL